MIINKYTGKTEEEAKAKAKAELGQDAIIMNIKEVRPKGVLGIFKSSTFEVTAAIEDDVLPKPVGNSKFNAVVDDSIVIPPMDSVAPSAGLHEDTLRDVFKAVEEVRVKAENNEVKHTTPLSQPQPQPQVQPQRVAPQMSSHRDTFEPLSSTVKTLHLKGEATYSRPEGVPVKRDNDEVRQLEERLSAKNRVPAEPHSDASIDNDNHVFVKMLYNVLLDNEVQEKYINQVLEDMDKVLRTSHSLDNLLSSVYQKMVLKLGQPRAITSGGKRVKVVFFIGPTGVGKTTTIAKVASRFKVDENRRVGLITADTYRMAAADQLRTYANILGAPMTVIYSGDELNEAVKRTTREYEDVDTILVDTIGFSHKNVEQKEDMKKLLDALDEGYDKEVYLVLSTTTKYKDLKDITDSYMEYTNFNLIFTKLDETSSYGNIYNIKLHTGASLSYVTYGQNVPEDIELVNPQKLVKQLLGGN